MRPTLTAPSYRVGVHIADAAAIIPLGGAIDREADWRMSTLYLPERTIGMLPAQVSHELGSLEAGETRAAISVLVRFSHLDEVTDWDCGTVRCPKRRFALI